jgi:hypothetical protein
MADLLGAMAMEKEYRKLQTDWEVKTAFGYHEKLQAFGFTDTVEYEKAKRLYYISNFNFTIAEIDITQLYSERQTAVENCEEIAHIVTASETCVIRGLLSDYNEQYCIDNNIYVFEHPAGGVLVTTPDDLIVSLVSQHHGLEEELLEKLRDDLISFGINCYIDNNDILVDGKKLVGFASIRLECVSIYAFQVSFVVDLELINTICLKPMEKEPIGLLEVKKVNRNQLTRAIKSWLQ